MRRFRGYQSFESGGKLWVFGLGWFWFMLCVHILSLSMLLQEVAYIFCMSNLSASSCSVDVNIEIVSIAMD